MRDDAVRKRLRALLDASNLDLEVVAPETDPLLSEPDRTLDLVVVRRSKVRPQDLELVDAYTRDGDRPGVVVWNDEGNELDRARLLAVGASGVLEPDDENRQLRGALEAYADSEGRGAQGRHGTALEPAPRLGDFHSRSPRMQAFLELVSRVVDTPSSLLITGETGVGKERLAQAIHNEGPRRDGPFVSVNCGALPEQLLESELFGHERGAFTGAEARRRGRFEQADGGTIFLDEIGEMPRHLQVKLLTVLQRRRVQRVGSEETVPVAVRVMAATNRDVEDEVRSGRFREDLYYRLNVVSLHIPALRERPEDIPDLSGSFIRYFREALNRKELRGLSQAALDAMLAYAWPGNVRELVNAIEHAVVLCRSASIEVEDLPESVARGTTEKGRSSEAAGSRVRTRFDERLLAEPLRAAKQRVAERFERDYLEALLSRAEGRINDTSRAAGISSRALYDKMRKHGLRKEDYRPPG